MKNLINFFAFNKMLAVYLAYKIWQTFLAVIVYIFSFYIQNTICLLTILGVLYFILWAFFIPFAIKLKSPYDLARRDEFKYYFKHSFLFIKYLNKN